MFIYFIYYNVWLNYSISRTSNFLKLDQLIEVSPPDYLLGWGHVSQQFTQKMNAYMIWHVYIYIEIYIYIHWYSTCLCVYVNQECMFRCTNQTRPMLCQSHRIPLTDGEDCIRIWERNSLAEMFIHHEKNLCRLQSLKDTAFSKWGKGCNIK